MSDLFAAPWWLLSLLLVPIAIAAYLVAQRRRSKYTVRFTNLELLESVVERSPGYRRHVPPLLFLTGLAVLGVALARPQSAQRVPKDQATVVLIIDVSGSMNAEDVAPTRIAAAQESANTFVDKLPPRINVGLIAFSNQVRVLAAPTQDRAVVHQGINSLKAVGGTAMGDAILTGIQLVRPEAADLAGPLPTIAPGSPDAKPGVTTDPSKQAPASVLLISDGANTVGSTQPLDAAEVAREVNVPVYTVALGTQDGVALIPDPRNGSVNAQPVPPDEETLREVSDRTQGQFFQAPSASQLKAVYDDLGSKIGFTTQRKDATHIPVAFAVVLLAASAAVSLAWFHRFV